MIEIGCVTFNACFKFQTPAQAHDGNAMRCNVTANNDHIPDFNILMINVCFRMNNSNARSVNKNLIALSFFYNLGIAGYNFNICFICCFFNAYQYLPKFVHSKPLFNNKAERKILCFGSAHGQIVHCSIDGQITNVSTRKKDRRNNIAICAESNFAVQFKTCTIVLLVQQIVFKNIKHAALQ